MQQANSFAVSRVVAVLVRCGLHPLRPTPSRRRRTRRWRRGGGGVLGVVSAAARHRVGSSLGLRGRVMAPMLARPRCQQVPRRSSQSLSRQRRRLVSRWACGCRSGQPDSRTPASSRERSASPIDGVGALWKRGWRAGAFLLGSAPVATPTGGLGMRTAIRGALPMCIGGPPPVVPARPCVRLLLRGG